MVRNRRISGSALRWERMHRDAAKALAAQAAEEGSRPDGPSTQTSRDSSGV
jgi:hypothetical protein